MTKFTTAIATAATALLLTGNAFAQMPAAGEGPLFLNEAHAVSPVSREAVRAEAAQKAHAALVPTRHASDNVSTMSLRSNPAQSRAEVRQETRDAFTAGFRPAAGERA